MILTDSSIVVAFCCSVKPVSLPEGHFIVHDFNSGRGNIDHVLICTKGIFTLETKSQGGEVTFDGEKHLQKGVEIISLKYLPKFLDRLPVRLTISEAGRIYNRIKAASKG
jgi:hypothetical protein